RLRRADEDVARLDVLVDEAEGVDVVEGAGELDEDLDDDLARRPLEEVAEGVAVDQLLSEEERVLLLRAAEVVDRREVRVVELGEEAELVLEAGGDVVHRPLRVREGAGDDGGLAQGIEEAARGRVTRVPRRL